MRLRLPGLLAAAALLAPSFAGGSQVGAYPVGPSFMSPNVEWLGTIPDAAGISAKFITGKDGKAKWMYMSTTKGLSIYDVSNPAVPIPQGRLPLPNFENEDVEGNEDLAIISFDGILGGTVYVIDVRNKLAPVLLSEFTAYGGSGHTSHCIDDCRWLYTNGGGSITVTDLKEPASPVSEEIPNPKGVGSGHDMDQDANGILWMTGGSGGAGFAVRPLKTGSPALIARTRKASPLNPVLISDMFVNGKNLGRGPEVNDFILHNSKRPVDAKYTTPKGKRKIDKGGVFLVTEEDYVPNCDGQGRFHTFDASGALKDGQPLRRLDTFKVTEGTMSPQNGERAEGTVFCSAHWFTVKDNIVAIGWYGAGTRFLDVSNPYDIRQVGYYLSPDQETWASYWVPGSDVVYSVDLERGLDIMKFTKPPAGTTYLAPAPVRTPGKISFLRERPNSPYALACPTIAPR